MNPSDKPSLQCTGITKKFPGVWALDDVNFDIYRGRVHGLVGANGAGKSTLFKILAGVHPQDGGTITIDNQIYTVNNTQDAIRRGVVTIHQDINLIDSLSVKENILLNNEFKRFGLLDRKAIHKYVERVLEEYGINIDPDMPVHGLPNDQKKLIQILRAVHLKASVLLMDEPTSSLTERGIAIVHGLIKNLAARGVGVVFISHYITEIFDVCDDITVLRDGRVVGKHRTADSSIHTVVMDMLGKELKQKQRSSAVIDRSSEVMLHVRDLTIPGKIKDVTFDLHRGEILGITGIIGSGLTDLSAALFNMGNTKGRSGRVSIDEDGILLDSPYTAIKSGIALLTNDRLNEGILPSFPIYENICLPILKRFRNPVGLLNLQDMIETGQRCIEKLSIKTRDAITKLY